MSDVQKIAQAVKQLSEPQLAEFRQWFSEFDAEAWDKQIEADAAAGKLDALIEERLAQK